ncbi:MAG: cysteine desulfurase [Limnochordaceae bacterium]|nr:cysteine desulfurase [Limnochordaceae bacterium]
MATCRDDFPVLDQTATSGRPLVYLDSAATSHKPLPVVEAERRFYLHDNANVHRAVHTLAARATDAYEQARRAVARFIGAPQPESVVFVRSTTEAINVAARSLGQMLLREGDEVLLTVMEHHSNLVPWQLVARATGARLRYARLLEDGTLDLDSVREILAGGKVRIVAVTHQSNVLGTVNPVAELAAMAHEAGAVILVDGAQSVPHMPVDVQALGCDLLAFSGHKMLGPTGIGVLWGRIELLERMEPVFGGGEMIREVELDHATWNDVPYKFEAGTPPIAQAVGLGAAVEYLESLGMANVHAHEATLARYAVRRLQELRNVRIYGPLDDRRGGLVAFNVDGVHPHDVATILDHEGVAVRAGHHCAQPLMRWLDVPATVRASFYVYNTEADIDALVEALLAVERVFGKGRR